MLGLAPNQTGVPENKKKTIKKKTQPKTTTITQKIRFFLVLCRFLGYRTKPGKILTIISQRSLTSIYDFVKQATFH